MSSSIGFSMAGKKKTVEQAIEREIAYRNKNETGRALSRTMSFSDWLNAAPKSDAGLQRLPAPHHEPTSPNVKSWNEHPTLPSPSENRTPRSLIKNEPSSDKESDPVNLNSARKDWIGPRKFSKKNLQVQGPKPFPKSNIPTKAGFNLKRKAAAGSRIKLLASSSHSTSPRKMARTSADNLVCDICQVSTSSARTLHQHLIGRAHKAKLKFAKLKKNCSNGRGNTGKPRCDVCRIWCSDRDALSLHLKGQKHKNKLHELKNGNGGNNMSAKRPIRCELCSVHCMNEDCFQMHLKGRQHTANAELKRRGML